MKKRNDYISLSLIVPSSGVKLLICRHNLIAKAI